MMVIFLSGCGQQPVAQNQPVAPIQEVQQPTQAAVNQQPVTPPPADDTSWKTYVNQTDGYQITLPDSWKGYQADNRALTDSNTDICFSFTQHSPHCIFSLISEPLSQKNNVALYYTECVIGETKSAIIVANDCCKGIASTGTNDKLDAFQNARCAEAPAIFKTFKVAN